MNDLKYIIQKHQQKLTRLHNEYLLSYLKENKYIVFRVFCGIPALPFPAQYPQLTKTLKDLGLYFTEQSFKEHLQVFEDGVLVNSILKEIGRLAFKECCIVITIDNNDKILTKEVI